MRVVVLMSTYNGEKYIEEQINSILNQKGDFELDLLVRDDGSKDKTQDILKKYSDEGKLQWYTGRNLGPGQSFMDLIKQSNEYDYYAFSDQDDFWEENKLENAINRIKDENGIILYCSNAELVDSRLENLGRKVYKQTPKTDFNTLICAGGILGCTMVFNNELAKKIKEEKIPQKIVLHDFYIAALCTALNGKIIFQDIATLKYRQHGNNVVGVSNGFFSKIKERLKDVFTRQKISIADQAKEILNIYNDEIQKEKIEWLEEVADYRKTFIKRIRLAFSKKTKYINKNMGIKLRFSILFGNR